MSIYRHRLNRKISVIGMGIVLVLLMGSCGPGVPAEEAPAAPAEEGAAPVAAPGNTPDCGSEIVTLTFMTNLSELEANLVQKQTAQFTSEHCPNITVELINEPEYSTFMNILLTKLAGGTPPDVVGAWQSQFEELKAVQQNFVPPQNVKDDLNMDVFTFSAQKANSDFDALPWSGELCIPNFRLLGIPQASQLRLAAYQLIDFLTAEEQQTENYEQLTTWSRYPTRKTVNDVGPGCEDTGHIFRRPTSEQRDKIRNQIGDDGRSIEDDLRSLESSLKGRAFGNKTYWPEDEDQKVTLNFDGVTGVGEGGKNGELYTVQVGVVPVVNTVSSDFFLESNLKAYFEKWNYEHLVVLGALKVIDPSVFPVESDKPVPSGTYAAVWQRDTNGDQFILVDRDGFEAYYGSFVDLNGKNVDDSNRQALQPFAMMQEGSPWWAFLCGDSRCGKIP